MGNFTDMNFADVKVSQRLPFFTAPTEQGQYVAEVLAVREGDSEDNGPFIALDVQVLETSKISTDTTPADRTAPAQPGSRRSITFMKRYKSTPKGLKAFLLALTGAEEDTINKGGGQMLSQFADNSKVQGGPLAGMGLRIGLVARHKVTQKNKKDILEFSYLPIEGYTLAAKRQGKK